MVEFGFIEKNESQLKHLLGVGLVYKNPNYFEYINELPHTPEVLNTSFGVILLNFMNKYGTDNLLAKVELEFIYGSKHSSYIYNLFLEDYKDIPTLYMHLNKTQKERQLILDYLFNCEMIIVGVCYLKNKENFEKTKIDLVKIKDRINSQQQFLTNHHSGKSGCSLVALLMFFLMIVLYSAI